jgi:adenine nucleotide transporter 17
MPLSAIVVRMQTSSEDNEEQTGPTVVKDRASIAQVANDIYQEKGLSGFWSGFRATAVLTLNPSLNLYFGELLKRVLLPRSRREHPPAAVIFLISAFASAISSMATYPLILAKTRLQWKSPSGQQRYTSTRQVLRAAYAQKQLGGLCELSGLLCRTLI